MLQAPDTQTLPQTFPRQLLQLPASLPKATVAATGPRQCFKPFRRPFQGNSRSHRPQPSVFNTGVQDCRLPALKPFKPLKPLKPFRSASLSKATLAASRKLFKATLAATGSNNASNPSASLSKATLAATRPSHLLLRDSRLPFARPQTPQTIPQAFPRQLLQLPAGLSKATLAATRPRHCFKPFRVPFQGNSRSYTPQPSVCKRFKTAVCPPSNPSNPSAGLSKASLAASRKPFQGNSRSYTPQTMLQTLPQAFPRQLSQLQAPSHLFLRAFKTAVCPTSNSQTLPQAFPRQLLQLSRKPFQGNSLS